MNNSPSYFVRLINSNYRKKTNNISGVLSSLVLDLFIIPVLGLFGLRTFE